MMAGAGELAHERDETGKLFSVGWLAKSLGVRMATHDAEDQTDDSMVLEDGVRMRIART